MANENIVCDESRDIQLWIRTPEHFENDPDNSINHGCEPQFGNTRVLIQSMNTLTEQDNASPFPTLKDAAFLGLMQVRYL